MVFRGAARAGMIAACFAVCLIPSARAAEATTPVKPAISEEASAAVAQMGKTLSAKQLSFTAKTIRVYQDSTGQPLHIFHTMKVVVRHPDRLAAHVSGDDGAHELLYDGKTVSIFLPDEKKYATIAAPKDITSMLDEVMDKLNVDFPLADFFTDAPDKAFLSGVTAGWQVGTSNVDGVECRHLFFSQQGGIDLELWVEKNPSSTPRRLIVSYRLLPGQPNFIAEFSNWDMNAHPADSEFAFQAPAGATKIDFERAGASGQAGNK